MGGRKKHRSRIPVAPLEAMRGSGSGFHGQRGTPVYGTGIRSLVRVDTSHVLLGIPGAAAEPARGVRRADGGPFGVTGTHACHPEALSSVAAGIGQAFSGRWL